MPPSSTHSCYFSKCCCCIDLKTGCFILAYLNLIGDTIYTIAIGDRNLDEISKYISKPEPKDSIPADIGISSVLLVFLILDLVFSIVLLVGLHKDKPGHVKSYLIYTGIFIGIYAVHAFGSFVLKKLNFEMICEIILDILIHTYFFFVIRSYYIDMKSSRNRRTGKV